VRWLPLRVAALEMVARARARAAPPPPRRILCPGAGGASGLAPAAGYLEARLRSMGEFARADMPGVDLYELLPLVDSSDMGPRDWLRVGAAIEALDARYAGAARRRAARVRAARGARRRAPPRAPATRAAPPPPAQALSW